jgi:hypothetical protein
MDEPFSRMEDPAKRADRYEKVADEYADLVKDASSPFFRAYFERIAERYRAHAQGELKVVAQGHAAASGHSAT